MKIAILYVFHKFTDHVKYFLDHGVIKNNKYDYYFIYNGNDDIDHHFTNLNLIYRENSGFDFGGWSDQLFRLSQDGKNLVKDAYDYYIFINSSVTGPFLPTYCDIPWPYIFIRLLNSDTILSGITINCGKWYPKNVAVHNGWNPDKMVAHVQSMLFCMNSDTLQFMIQKEIFHPTKFLNVKHNHQIILNCEIRMSDEILKSGKNIACLMRIYKNVDFRYSIPIKCDDPWYENGVLGNNLDPFETVFYKNNRDINPKLLNYYMTT